MPTKLYRSFAESKNLYRIVCLIRSDAWDIQVAGEGVPCVVVSLPLKYMHTTVEVGSTATMADQARLLCETVCRMKAGWEETLCF